MKGAKRSFDWLMGRALLLAFLIVASSLQIQGCGDSYTHTIAELATSTSSISFEETRVGKISIPVSLTVKNRGNGVAAVTGMNITDGFAIGQSSCGRSILPGTECTVSLRYQPHTPGAAAGTFTLVTPTSDVVVNLSGLASEPRALLSVAPSSLAFPDTKVGAASATLSTTLLNSGDGSANLSQMVASEGFALDRSSCGTTLTPGSTCGITVRFVPKVPGLGTGLLNIISDVGTESVHLVGTALKPVAILTATPQTLTFPDTKTGSTSATQTVTLMNSGDGVANMLAAQSSAGFVIKAETCVSPLNPSAMCTFDLAFSPRDIGSQSGSLDITTDSGTFSVKLAGTAHKPTASLAVYPNSLKFSETNIGDTSSPQGVTIRNTGDGDALFATWTIGTGFVLDSTGCPKSLVAGSSCSATVRFAPLQSGLNSSLLSVATDSGQFDVQLAGSAHQPVANLSLAPQALSFPETKVNNDSSPQIAILQNAGDGDGKLGTWLVTPPFRIESNGCTGILGAGKSCTVSLHFSPTAPGAVSGLLTVTTELGPLSIKLFGTGRQPVASLSATPGMLTFPDTKTGSDSAGQTVTLLNSGDGAAQLSSWQVPSGFVIDQNTCGSSLGAGASCSVAIRFAPKAPGATSGALHLSTDTASFDIQLYGTAIKPVAVVTIHPPLLQFPETKVGSMSQAMVFSLENTGDGSATLSQFTASDGYKVDASACSNLLPAGSQCSVQVYFVPNSQGTASGTVTVAVDGAAQIVALSGYAPQPVAALSASPNALMFPDTRLESSSAPLSVQLRNQGNAAAVLASLKITGGFVIEQTSCTGRLEVNASCSASLHFTPSSLGKLDGNLIVTWDSGTIAVPLSGVALSAATPKLSITPDTLNFGDLQVGALSAAMSSTLLNSGDGPALLGSLVLSAGYTIDHTSCTDRLDPGSTCTVFLHFISQTAGASSGLLTIPFQKGSVLVRLLANVLEPPKATIDLSAPKTAIRAGEQMQLTAAVHGGATTSVQWSTSANATIDASGMLTVSASAKAFDSIEITAVLTTDFSVTAKMYLPVWNALPTLTGASVTELIPGSSPSVTLYGAHLDSVDRLQVNGKDVAYTVISSTSLSTQINSAPWEATPKSVVAILSGPQGGSSAPLTLPMKSTHVSFDAAVRLSQQAGFGANPEVISRIQTIGMAAWIDAQLTSAPYDYSSDAGRAPSAWYRHTQDANSVLRQRLALALSQIYVVGGVNNCGQDYCGPIYQTLLERDAFQNIRTLLTDVMLYPIMGEFLNNLYNSAGRGAIPNQNFAREFLQLMTIGTVQLNQDGSEKLGSDGQPLQSYTQDNIVAMSNALSGFGLQFPYQDILASVPYPMTFSEEGHNQNAKAILPGIILPAGLGSNADVSAVLDAVIQHPNMGPFICRRLIQHLVKSNPSGPYINRISTVFNDNGRGQKGDLAAVVKSILLDSEARAGDVVAGMDATDGHVMEPILYLANVMNDLEGAYTDDQIRDIDSSMGQQLYIEPSVFGPYSPDHKLASGIFAPEAQLLDTQHAVIKMSVLQQLFAGNAGGMVVTPAASRFANATSQDELLDRINHLLLHGTMTSAMHEGLSTYMQAHATQSLNDQLPGLLFLALNSSQYQVIH